MDIAVVLTQTNDDALPAIRIVVYPVITFKEKLSFK
jgi:hypothetical protein